MAVIRNLNQTFGKKIMKYKTKWMREVNSKNV